MDTGWTLKCELCPDGIIPCRCGQLICMTQARSCHQDSPTPPPAAPCLMGLWALSVAKMGKNYYIHFSVSFDDDRISFRFESGIIFLRDWKIFDRGNHLHHHLNVGHTGVILTRKGTSGGMIKCDKLAAAALSCTEHSAAAKSSANKSDIKDTFTLYFTGKVFISIVNICWAAAEARFELKYILNPVLITFLVFFSANNQSITILERRICHFVWLDSDHWWTF